MGERGPGKATVVVVVGARGPLQGSGGGGLSLVSGPATVVPLVGQSGQSRWWSGQRRLGHQSGMPQKRRASDTKYNGRRRQERRREVRGRGLGFLGLFCRLRCLLLSAHAKSYWNLGGKWKQPGDWGGMGDWGTASWETELHQPAQPGERNCTRLSLGGRRIQTGSRDASLFRQIRHSCSWNMHLCSK